MFNQTGQAHSGKKDLSLHIWARFYQNTVSYWSLINHNCLDEDLSRDLDLWWSSSAPASAPKIFLPRAWEQNIIQNPAPYLGAPELFWKFGRDPSLSNSTSIFRERNCTTNRHSCTPNLPAPCTTTSSCACLNSSHLLFLLQICTSFKADLELSKIEHRLGAKFDLKKQRGKKKVLFSHLFSTTLFFNSTATLALQCYSYTDIPAGTARNGHAASLSAFLGNTALHLQLVSPCFPEVQSCGTPVHTADTCPYSLDQCQSGLYLMCVCVCARVRVRRGHYRSPLPPKSTNAITWRNVT